jgi:C1A family cysteine protease
MQPGHFASSAQLNMLWCTPAEHNAVQADCCNPEYLGGLLHALLCLLQDQGECSSCIGFAMTAAAEAALNVYKQQSWQKASLSEQDMSFCKYAMIISSIDADVYSTKMHIDLRC